MTRDWAAEWEREQESVDDLLAMFEKYNACEHVWVPDKGEHVALSWVANICVKCGGGMEVVDASTFYAITDTEPEPLLPEAEGQGRHCM